MKEYILIGCKGKVYWYGIGIERGERVRLGWLGWIEYSNRYSISIVHCHVSKVKTNQ